MSVSKKTKLELTWIGKEHRPKLEPRILLEEPERSHHAAQTSSTTSSSTGTTSSPSRPWNRTSPAR